MKGLEWKTGAGHGRECSGKQLCGAEGSDRFPLCRCTTIPHCPGTETSTLNLLNSLMGEININHCNPQCKSRALSVLCIPRLQSTECCKPRSVLPARKELICEELIMRQTKRIAQIHFFLREILTPAPQARCLSLANFQAPKVCSCLSSCQPQTLHSRFRHYFKLTEQNGCKADPAAAEQLLGSSDSPTTSSIMDAITIQPLEADCVPAQQVLKSTGERDSPGMAAR